MIIEKVELQSFRQYQSKAFHFSPRTTVIVGPNGSGKTNLLEALSLLSTGKSFHADADGEMIAFGSELARAQAVIQSKEKKGVNLEVVVTRGEVMKIKTPYKRFTINGVGKRLYDFSGILKTVLFWPQDLLLVTHTPSLRRRYLDFVLSQADRHYHRSLVTYEKALRQRNKLLESIRDTGASRDQLSYWDDMLIKAGGYISTKREGFIRSINTSAIDTFVQGSDVYRLIYDKSEISESRLAQYKQEEVAAAATLVGPHRDDVVFRIRNKELGIKNQAEWLNLAKYGSRGEQRLAILWLKCCELAYIERETGEKPVLLLDDIFSELDEEHRAIVTAIMPLQQTIVTTIDRHAVKMKKDAEISHIELGL